MIISVTRFHLKSIFYLPRFFRLSRKSSKQAGENSGLIKLNLKGLNLKTFMTLSAWKDTESLKEFMKGEPHLTAIRITKDIAKGAETVRWEADEFPTWSEAIQKLNENGRSYIRKQS